MLSNRSKLSLCQFLGLHERGFLRAILQKHNFPTRGWYPVEDIVDVLRESILPGGDDQLHCLLGEILRTQGDMRSRVSPRYRYDERWTDLVACLELDGYRVEGQSLRTVDPTIEQAAPLEDDLTAEIKRSLLPEAPGIVQVLEKSANAYRQTPPDYNACLTDARVALQTLARDIARQRQAKHPGSFGESKWGEVLSYLRTSGFVTKKEEETLAGVFTFVSDGAHVPVGLTQQEMVRLGRSFVVGMCYFLVKRHNSGCVP